MDPISSGIEKHILKLPTSPTSRFCFAAGETIVREGVFARTLPAALRYAPIPFSYIVSGEAVILENGKAVKYLKAGDQFGIFETAYFLTFNTSRQCGRWTLVASSPVEVAVFSKAVWHSPDSAMLSQSLRAAATQSHVPKPLTRLPLLDSFVHQQPVTFLNDCAIVVHTHMLDTSYDLVKHLATLVGYHNVFVMEKPYSTIRSVWEQVVQTGVHTATVRIDPFMPYDFSVDRAARHLWSRVVEHVHNNKLSTVVVVSDGADMLLTVPWDALQDVDVVGVEQTQRGLTRIHNMGRAVPPVVDVATSALKKIYESPFIGSAVFQKIKTLGLCGRKLSFGVIGTGAIGAAIVAELQMLGETVRVYDIHSGARKEYSHADSLEELVNGADVIIGTTGIDVLRGMYMARLHGHKTFISASSSNVEFAYLFDIVGSFPNAFEDVTMSVGNQLTCTILNGGYPINFDRTKEWEAREDIQLTRTLMYAATLQALSLRAKRGSVTPLAGSLQDHIFTLWQAVKKTG